MDHITQVSILGIISTSVDLERRVPALLAHAGGRGRHAHELGQQGQRDQGTSLCVIGSGLLLTPRADAHTVQLRRNGVRAAALPRHVPGWLRGYERRFPQLAPAPMRPSSFSSCAQS